MGGAGAADGYRGDAGSAGLIRRRPHWGPRANPVNAGVYDSAMSRLRSACATLLTVFVIACGDDGAELPAQQSMVARTATIEGVEALVRRADSLELQREWSAAADSWRAAASRFPALSDWFTLKAAAAHSDARTRTRWLNGIRALPTSDSAALNRRKEGSHLRALLRVGDTTTAVQRYLTLGNVRDSVVGLSLRERHGEPLTEVERLQLARGARRIGDAPLARRVYGELLADRSTRVTDDDRYQLGMLLFEAGAFAEAIRVWAVTGGDYRGRADYQRARALSRLGRAADARSALVRVTRQHRGDTTAAGLAWYLLGDLASDAARDSDALMAWRTLAEQYPSHPLAPRARFRSAIINASLGKWSDSEREWRLLAARSSDEQSASRYWLARSLAEQGKRAPAEREWRALIADAPDSYYALLAARRVRQSPWRDSVASRGRSGPAAARLDSAAIAFAFQRAAWLDSLGLRSEARDERGDLLRVASASAPDARAVAAAFAQRNLASPAIQLATRLQELVLQRGESLTADDQRLRFPLPFVQSLQEYARRSSLKVPFVAALIRQESRFTPDARSGAGARGLMQVMPPVGRSLATAVGIAPWHDSLLYVPAINLQLGTRHLAAALRVDGRQHPAYALAAYNAGRSRMVRWRAMRGAAADWELFVERIPYVETRDYVRIVLRNEEWYRVLYPSLVQDE